MANPAVVASLLLARCQGLSSIAPVAMPDVAFAPTPTQPFLRVALFHNSPFWSALAHRKADQGLLVITACWPKGKGIVKGAGAAASVIAHFPKGLRLADQGVTVRVSGDAWAAGAILGDVWSETPVSVPWRAY